MQRRTAVLVLLAALVATSGCAALTDDGSPSDDGDDPAVSADAVQSRTLDALRNVSTYEYRLTGTQNLAEVTVAINATGVVNRTARRMYAETTATASRGDRSNTATTRTYVVNDTSYVHSQGAWRAQPLQRDAWSQNVLGRQRALLANATVTVLNRTTVDGVETYAVEVDPAAGSVEEYVENRGNVNADVSVGSVRVVQYVAADTYRVHRSVMDMSLTVGDQSLDQHLVVTFQNYGAETNVTVPEAATG